MSAWTLAYDGFDPASEGSGRRCARSVRPWGRPEASADAVHYPGTHVGGVSDRAVSRVAGREVENEDLVNVPNWLPVTIRLDGGQWLDLQTQEVLGYRQELDLRRSVLTRLLRVRHLQGTHDPGRRILEAAGDSTNRYKASSRRMC